jgi:hypothetical protein
MRSLAVSCIIIGICNIATLLGVDEVLLAHGVHFSGWNMIPHLDWSFQQSILAGVIGRGRVCMASGGVRSTKRPL